MEITKTRKEHQCILCDKTIPIHSQTLVVYTDMRTYAGRHYYCKECGMKRLGYLLTTLKLQKGD